MPDSKSTFAGTCEQASAKQDLSDIMTAGSSGVLPVVLSVKELVGDSGLRISKENTASSRLALAKAFEAMRAAVSRRLAVRQRDKTMETQEWTDNAILLFADYSQDIKDRNLRDPTDRTDRTPDRQP